jgi:uncharacterized membrane protein YhaH (DUF805 family)
MNWYLGVLKNYAGFSGRARRKEYWMYALFNTIILVVLEILTISANSTFVTILFFAYALAVLIPSLAVAVRRMHDQGKSGAWVLITCVPFIGSLWLLALTCIEGTRGPNQYGPDPKALAA